jgi:sucrose-phosphate synthase
MGKRDDIWEMSFGSGSVLTNVLKLIDKYDLYGHVMYPKHHKQSDVPEIYWFAAITKECKIYIESTLLMFLII